MPYGLEIADKVVSYHKLHGGVSEFEKFKYFQKVLNEIISDDKIDELATNFQI